MEQLGEEMEARDEQVKELALEQLKLMQKLFVLTDLDARIQANHFPELSKSIGKNGMYEWAFPDKSKLVTERKKAEQQMAAFGNFMSGKKK